MQIKKVFEKIFIFVAAIAICVLLVLDAVALVDKFGGEKAKQIVGSVGTQAAVSEPSLTDLLKQVSNGTSKTATLAFGTYAHEGGEKAFENVRLVPTIALNEDGSFVFVENTGSGMGNCSGTAVLSPDGGTLTCSVVTADISCPDEIIFTVEADGSLTLATDMRKSVAGNRFLLQEAQE